MELVENAWAILSKEYLINPWYMLVQRIWHDLLNHHDDPNLALSTINVPVVVNNDNACEFNR